MLYKRGGHHGHDCMVVGFTYTYMYLCNTCISPLMLKVRILFMARYTLQHYVIKFVMNCGRSWFSPSTPVSSINKTNRHDITDIVLKVALNAITLTLILNCALNKSHTVAKNVFSELKYETTVNIHKKCQTFFL
jgi:hypothetical protein